MTAHQLREASLQRLPSPADLEGVELLEDVLRELELGSCRRVRSASRRAEASSLASFAAGVAGVT